MDVSGSRDLALLAGGNFTCEHLRQGLYLGIVGAKPTALEMSIEAAGQLGSSLPNVSSIQPTCFIRP